MSLINQNGGRCPCRDRYTPTNWASFQRSLGSLGSLKCAELFNFSWHPPPDPPRSCKPDSAGYVCSVLRLWSTSTNWCYLLHTIIYFVFMTSSFWETSQPNLPEKFPRETSQAVGVGGKLFRVPTSTPQGHTPGYVSLVIRMFWVAVSAVAVLDGCRIKIKCVFFCHAFDQKPKL